LDASSLDLTCGILFFVIRTFDQCSCFIDRSDSIAVNDRSTLQCASGRCHEHQITYQPAADMRSLIQRRSSISYLRITRTHTDVDIVPTFRAIPRRSISSGCIWPWLASRRRLRSFVHLRDQMHGIVWQQPGPEWCFRGCWRLSLVAAVG
jgi:hypothetical protein